MAQLSVRNPFSGKADYTFEVTDVASLGDRVASVRAAQPSWAARSLAERAAVLRRFSVAIEHHADAIYDALSADTGRSLIARIEIASAGGLIEGAIGSALALLDTAPARQSVDQRVWATTQWVPYGVVGVISPWNFPLILSFTEAIPALMSGNGVVVKPSEITPRFVEPLRLAIADVPEFDGLFEFVMGAGDVGAALIDHVDIIGFTGSSRTGQKVAEAAARNFIPAFLELGGKDPAIVTASADVSIAARTVLRATVAASGQACQSLERVYVDAGIYDEFVDRLLTEIKTVTLNKDDWEGGTIGPAIMGAQADIYRDHLADAVAKGAEILHGGTVIDAGGLWMEPTLLVNVDHSMKIMREETFGPILPVMKFETLEEAITLANDTDYGLSASVFSTDADEAHAVAKRLNAGTVSVNDGSLTAFVHDIECETFGCSGMGGTRFGPEGILRFVRRKAIMDMQGAPQGLDGQPIT